MKHIFYFLITAITIATLNMNLLGSSIPNLQTHTIIEGTINTFEGNPIKYVVPENLKGVTKELYKRYNLPASIPCIDVEIACEKNFNGKDTIIQDCRKGIPLTLLAPFFDKDNENPIVEFVINQYKFKLKPLIAALPSIIKDYENEFITKIDKINLYPHDADELIRREIISDKSNSADRYPHGKNGYPAYKNKFFTIFAAMQASIDNPSQIIIAPSTIAEPCQECLKKEDIINTHGGTITSLLTSNENQKIQITSLEEQITLLTSQAATEKECAQCPEKDEKITSLEQNITILKNQAAENFKNNSQIQLIEKLKQEKNDILESNTKEIPNSEINHLKSLTEKNEIIINLYTQASNRAKTFGSIAFISAFLGIGTGLYAWYKPSQSPILPMLSTFFLGGATTSSITAWHFYKTMKEHKQN